jgi:hypothetical protein
MKYIGLMKTGGTSLTRRNGHHPGYEDQKEARELEETVIIAVMKTKRS